MRYAEDQTLNFCGPNLTVVYGDNAAGKTGIISASSRARAAPAGKKKILGNVVSGAAPLRARRVNQVQGRNRT
ncbi:MAG: ATP-binding protein [Comamonadaceae bacterium]|nr:ATP-binding protein [Comamonadaceae bacterium]